jgi:hypothetical protein
LAQMAHSSPCAATEILFISAGELPICRRQNLSDQQN